MRGTMCRAGSAALAAASVVLVAAGAVLAQSSGGGGGGGSSGSGGSAGSAGSAGGSSAGGGTGSAAGASTGTGASGGSTGSAVTAPRGPANVPGVRRTDPGRTAPGGVSRPAPATVPPTQDRSRPTDRALAPEAGGSIGGRAAEGGAGTGGGSGTTGMTGPSTAETLAQCKALWDRSTHMTKERWNEVCERTERELTP